MTQTLLNDESTVGNCVQAAIATVLDKPIEMVPHFGVFPDWGWALRQYLAGQELRYRRLRGQDCVNGFQTGMTVRGTRHCVAFVDGEMWDPHPSRAGLISVDGIFEIEPVEAPTEG